MATVCPKGFAQRRERRRRKQLPEALSEAMKAQGRWPRCARKDSRSGASVEDASNCPKGFAQRRERRRREQLPEALSEAQKASEAGLSAPERIRTFDLRFRRPTLYPAELRARVGGELIA
jgi:hypothetical protein